MVMAGHSKAEIVLALKAAFDNKELPDLENGNMVFMMSKSAYLYDDGDHNGPHLMFFTALKDGKDWGAFASGSPVVSGPYWFLTSKESSQAKGCRRFLCSQSKLPVGPTERPHPCIKSRLTTTAAAARAQSYSHPSHRSRQSDRRIHPFVWRQSLLPLA